MRSSTSRTLQAFFLKPTPHEIAVINEGNLQGHSNASTAPLFTTYLSYGSRSKYYAADSSYFRDEEAAVQNFRQISSILSFWITLRGCRLHNGIAMHQDSVRGFGCIMAWQCIKGSNRALSG